MKTEHEKQLEAQVRELAERLHGLETVTASVAHDLRNALNNVGLNVHLLRSALEDGNRELCSTAIGHIELAKAQMLETLDRLRAPKPRD